MPGTTTWTKAQVEDLVRTEKFRYHRIELPYGIVTDGRDRSNTARAIFPEDLTGKSVLDLGCAEGYLSFEAKKRGASRVVGLDVEAETIRRNSRVADCLGLDVEFDVVDLDRDRLTEKFDYVLCLNVLHHLRYPLQTLDNLAEITGEKLVLEMASFGMADSLRMGIFPGLSPLISRLPIMFVSPGHANKKLKRFAITQSAIRNLLMTHRRIFSSCDIAPSDHKNRYLVVARKYAIDHLIVVAAPSGADTSGFATQLVDGQWPAVETALGERTSRASRMESSNQSQMAVAVMEYDILNPFMRTGNVYSRDIELDLLSVAKKVSFVTLKPTAAELFLSFQAHKGRGFLAGKVSKRDRRILESYASEIELAKHYRSWLAFANSRSGTSIVVNAADKSVEDGTAFLAALPA